MQSFGKKEEGITYIERRGAYGILLNEDTVLVEKTYLGYFLPGGGLERGETRENALRREYLEETGFEVVPIEASEEVAQFTHIPHSQRYLKKLCTFFLVDGFQKFATPLHPDCDPDGTPHVAVWIPIREAENALYLAAERWALTEYSRDTTE